MTSRPTMLPREAAVWFALLWLLVVVGALILMFGGRADHHRRRRRHRDDMGRRGLPTHYDDTGVLDPEAWWHGPNAGHFHNGRTYVRRVHHADESTSTYESRRR